MTTKLKAHLIAIAFIVVMGVIGFCIYQWPTRAFGTITLVGLPIIGYFYYRMVVSCVLDLLTLREKHKRYDLPKGGK